MFSSTACSLAKSLQARKNDSIRGLVLSLHQLETVFSDTLSSMANATLFMFESLI